MNKLKTFFTSFKRSLTDVSYYKDILQAKFSFSLKYLYFLLFLISFFWSVKAAVDLSRFIPQVPGAILKVKEAASGLYPRELVLTMKNGELSTNVKEPYYFDFPKSWEDANNKNTEVTYVHLITIDTKASIGDISSLSTGVLVTKNAVIYRKNQGYEVQLFDQLKNNDFVFNKTLYDQLLAKVLPYLSYAVPFLYGLIAFVVLLWPFMAASSLLLWNLIYLAVVTLFVFLWVKIFKKQYQFGEVYRVAMHAITLPIVFGFIQDLAGVHLPFMGTIVLILSMIIILYKTERAEVQNKP